MPLPWVLSVSFTLSASLQEDHDDCVSKLGVFLDSLPMEQSDPDYQINAVFEIAAENKDPTQTEARPLFHDFRRDSADWGFKELVHSCCPLAPLTLVPQLVMLAVIFTKHRRCLCCADVLFSFAFYVG